MILSHEFQEAYDILSFICSKVPVLEQGLRDGLLQGKTPCIMFYEDKVQYISMGCSTSDFVQSNIKFASMNDYSFIRSEDHRKSNVNIHLVYNTCSHLRLGKTVIDNFEYSEENVFQQSLVLDNESALDLDFITFLKKKKFNQTLMFKRNGYSLDGLKMIKERVEEALCYLSDQKYLSTVKN